MRWNRKAVILLLSCLFAGGMGALFIFLPQARTQSMLPGYDHKRQPPESLLDVPAPKLPPPDLPLPPDLTAYAPDVQTLIETTYLGRVEEFPDPGEPAIVLQKHLEQNAHGYHQRLASQKQQPNAKLSAWVALAHQYPQSRHALVALTKH